MTTIGEEILRNRFLDRLRNELIIDRSAYALLCDQLRRLATELSRKDSLPKPLAQELYVLPKVIHGVGLSLRPHRPDLADELDTMAHEIDALILECLA